MEEGNLLGLAMSCPSCARPVAMARPQCVYCGATLSNETREEAGRAAQRVLQSNRLADLEAAAQGTGADQQPRGYLVIDTTGASTETIAAACSVAVWEARQWQTASRYRLIRVSTEPPFGPYETGLRSSGIEVFLVRGETVARRRNPIVIQSIDMSGNAVCCTLRDDAEEIVQRVLSEPDLAIIVSASIRREKVREQTSLRNPPDTRLPDTWLVHLHLKSETRPLEIDLRRTEFAGPGLASATMRTRDLVRRLSTSIPHDEAFKTVVPALSPAVDPLTELLPSKAAAGSTVKPMPLVVRDNVAQFREYSAWRGAVEILRQATPPSAH